MPHEDQPGSALRFIRAPSVVEQAIEALIVLAQAPPGERTRVGDICDADGLSRKVVATALNDLRPLGLVGSRRGNHGGYVLTAPASEITIAQVFDAVDPRAPRPVPDPEGAARLWLAAEETVRARYGAISIGDLIRSRVV